MESKERTPKNAEGGIENIGPDELKNLIEKGDMDKLEKLSAVNSALDSIEEGDVEGALMHLLTDADKIRMMNRDLYDFLTKNQDAILAKRREIRE